MEKRILKSDEEYFNLCVEEKIGDIQRHYCSQYADVGERSDSVECDFWHKYVYGKHKDDWESLHVKRKPKSYPCVFVWYCDEGDHDHWLGRFVYPSDFE